MLERIGRLVQSFDRSPGNRLRQALEQLAQGWSLEAFQALQKCAEEGLAEAQYELARRYEQADGVVQDLGDAVHWYRAAATQNHVPAQARLGLILLSAPVADATAASGTVSAGDREAGAADPAELATGSFGEAFRNAVLVRQDAHEAAVWHQRAAEAGNSEAQLRLGHQYASGLGLERDLAKAREWLRKSADQGDIAGMTALGALHAGAYGGPADPALALPWLRRAAESGDASARYWLGVVLQQVARSRTGREAQALHAESAGVLEAAAEQGHVSAMFRLGLAYWTGANAPRDVSRAETWLRRAASRGDIGALRALAQLQLEQPDNDGFEAAALLWQAAEAGDLRAAALLGELYLEGRGLPRDLVEAARWLDFAGVEARAPAMTALASQQASRDADGQGYALAAEWLRRAARKGDLAAKFTLGSLYRQGKGVPSDPFEAAQWFRQSAEAGSAPAAFYLGLLYADSHTPLHDDRQAVLWLRRAALGGHALALCNLALMILLGRGEVRDPVRAVAMLEAAVANGNMEAGELLAEWYSSGDHLQPGPQQALRHLRRALELGSVKAACVLVELRETAADLDLDWARVRSLLAAACAGQPGATAEDEATARAAAGRRHGALARVLEHGLGGEPDAAAARQHYELAAIAGWADAQLWLGDWLAAQKDDPAAPAQAESWYRKAAQQGQAPALVRLAGLLSARQAEADDSVDTSAAEERFGLWLAAAGAGEVVAQREAGLCYLRGDGCRAYAPGAVRWLALAASGGDAEAQYRLACCHRDGIGTRRDPALARLWFERAAARQHPAALEWQSARRQRQLAQGL